MMTTNLWARKRSLLNEMIPKYRRKLGTSRQYVRPELMTSIGRNSLQIFYFFFSFLIISIHKFYNNNEFEPHYTVFLSYLLSLPWFPVRVCCFLKISSFWISTKSRTRSQIVVSCVLLITVRHPWFRSAIPANIGWKLNRTLPNFKVSHNTNVHLKLLRHVKRMFHEQTCFLLNVHVCIYITHYIHTCTCTSYSSLQ